MDKLSLDEAARIVGKDKRTIRRWKASGVDVSNKAELIECSQHKDARARGSSANLARRRIDRKPRATPLSGLRQYFALGIDPEAFVQLPAPYRPEAGNRALELLSEIRGAFARRLEELKAIGHEYSIKLAQTDLDAISEALRLLEKVTEGFEA